MCIKKWPALLLAVILLVSLAACGPAQIAAPAQQPSQELTLLPPEEKQDTDLVLLPPDPAPPSEEQMPEAPPAEEPPAQEPALDEDGSYTSKEDVSLYIHLYGRLPDNFITKKEAEALGWSGGSLEPYAPGKCIGGSYFGNYEGLLPKKKGRSYTECDIDTLGKKSRGSKRIVFSNDGLIYYTEDHYNTFELLYGEVD